MTSRIEDLLDAAARVIARDGVDALRMSDVAREAGVSTALVHYYVSTRDELLALVFARTDAISDALAVAASRGLATGAERLEAMLTAYLEDSSAVAETWAVSIEVWRTAMFNPKLRAPALESYQEWLDLLIAELDAGKADGSISADVASDDASWTLAATLDGLAQQVVLGSLSHERAKSLLRHCLRSTLVGVERRERVAG
jgi:AcrR family transcriptional regulator